MKIRTVLALFSSMYVIFLAFAYYFLRLYFCQYFFFLKEASLFHITIPDFIQKQRGKQHRAWLASHSSLAESRSSHPCMWGTCPPAVPQWPFTGSSLQVFADFALAFSPVPPVGSPGRRCAGQGG